MKQHSRSPVAHIKSHNPITNRVEHIKICSHINQIKVFILVKLLTYIIKN